LFLFLAPSSLLLLSCPLMNAPVLTSKEGPVSTLTLNRPDKRNALNIELLESLCAALAVVEADASQRIIVLRGAGSVFCSGMDLAEATALERAESSAELIGRTLHSLARSRLISIAAVQGAAVAGGAGIMSACDFAVATVDAKFGYPELRRGIVPALIMTFVRRQLRERDARELLFLGKLFDAERALAIGLINRTVADATALDVEVRSMISSLLQAAPQALAETKALLNELWPSPLANDLRQAHEHHLATRKSPEAREGIAAFIEKRAPNWAPRT
jgi:methylglutaconyl-CoA hydratase